MFSIFKSARRALRRGLAIASLTALVACDSVPLGDLGNVFSGQRINPNKPVPVALLVPRGSGKTGDEVLAASLENAARLAVAELEGAQIDLRVYNTAADVNTAVQQAELAVKEGAKIILGPVYGESANAVGRAVADKNVNVMAFSNNPTIAGGNVFILGPTYQNTAERLLGFAAGRGNKRIVVVHDTGAAGQLGRDAIQKAAGLSGTQIVGSVAYELSQESVAAAVPRIKSAVNSAGADAIFLTSTSSGALPLFSGILPSAGVAPDRVQYIGLTRWDVPQQTLSFPGLQGGLFALPDPTRVAAYNNLYQKTYGRQPHPIGALAFDGIAAIGASVATGNPEALTGEALTQANGFQGASGAFRLKADGTNQRAIAVATVSEGKALVLSPAPSSFAGF
jgi:ABC-type branched-subunit amino acid transport system substrate-binding protein